MSEDALPGGFVWTSLEIVVKKPQITQSIAANFFTLFASLAVASITLKLITQTKAKFGANYYK